MPLFPSDHLKLLGAFSLVFFRSETILADPKLCLLWSFGLFYFEKFNSTLDLILAIFVLICTANCVLCQQPATLTMKGAPELLWGTAGLSQGSFMAVRLRRLVLH